MQAHNSTIFRYSLLCAILVFSGTVSYSQSRNQLVFRKVDEQNGLSDNVVQCVYKDQRNFVWIGTASGLNLMDGSSLTVYKNEPGKNSISNNNIQVITEDHKGFLWIGTKQGLNIFNPLTDKFNTVSLPKFNDYKKDNIKSLAVDKENNLYIGTASGLYFYNSTIKKISPIELSSNNENNVRNNIINYIHLDRSGKLWIATFNGLWSYSAKNQKKVQEINAGNDSLFRPIFSKFIIDHAGKIWCGLWNNILLKFDPASKKISNYLIPDVEPIISLAEIKKPDGNYILWLSGKGIGFDPSTDKLIHFQKPPDLPDFPFAIDLYTSRDNWLWMGTLKGLYYYNPARTVLNLKMFDSKTTDQSVAITEWNNKLFVSGSGTNFLKTYNDNLDETGNYSDAISKFGPACLSLQPLTQNSLIAGTTVGIATIHLSTHKVQFNHLSFLQKKLPSGNFINFLLKDRAGGWWIFPWRMGIWKADSDFQNFHQAFTNFLTENGSPKPLVISDAVEDDDNNLYFADLDEGIIFYNRKSQTFSKPFKKELGEKYGTSQMLYYKKNYYSFSGNKIYTWNTISPNNLQRIDLPSQLDKPIVSIAMDSSGRLWAATGQGLVVYNFGTKSFERFTTADGLVTNNMVGTLYCRKNGIIVCGSALHLFSFNPDQMLVSVESKPELQLEKVLVNGTPSIFDSTKSNRFNYTENNFVFKWSVTDYNSPFNNHYYYQLKGIDTGWRDNGIRGEINFSNLSYGKYILLLKGENSNGIDADRILKFRFEIFPPFWQRWWFLSLVALLVAALLYSFYRYRLQQALKLEKLRNKISLDLHDDIGSTLSSISILSEMALRQNKDSEKSSMLNEIKENSISLMEKMDDIVWSINPEKDSVGNLFVRIKTFAAKLFEAKEINYSIEIENDLKPVKLSMRYRQHIYLIMKESINNLVKYADGTEAEIKVSIESGYLKILIRDNGKGFDKNQQYRGNGIRSMQKRAEEMNAKLEIDTHEKKGTTIILFIKIK